MSYMLYLLLFLQFLSSYSFHPFSSYICGILWLFTGTTVASPGRCQVLVLDEADRMIDLGFEEEIRNTLDHYRGRVAAAPAVLGLVYGKWMLPCYSPAKSHLSEVGQPGTAHFDYETSSGISPDFTA